MAKLSITFVFPFVPVLLLSKSPIAGKKVTNFPSKKRHVAIYKLKNHKYGDKSGNSDAKQLLRSPQNMPGRANHVKMPYP